jgi:quercetin dioxygenase-like cupin family protein
MKCWGCLTFETTSAHFTASFEEFLMERCKSMSDHFIHVPAMTGVAYWVMGDLFTYLVTGAESGGSSFTLESDVAPGHGPPPHIHHLEDEQFYVLEGEITFQVGDRTIQATAGDFIYIPRQVVHAFKNGAAPAKLLATFTPAGIEGFFQEAGEPALDRSAPPPVTAQTIARFVAAEAAGWRDHHETLPPP